MGCEEILPPPDGRCIDCGEDIGKLGSRSIRCKKCQRDYNNFKRREKRAKEKEGVIRICRQCDKTDISDRHPRTQICWKCRRKNAAKAGHGYWLKHRKEHRKAQHKYYDKNKEKIIIGNIAYRKKKRREKKRILELDLNPENRHKKKIRRDLWVEWDDIPRCEGTIMDYKSFNNFFGDRCILRASYRLVDKHDKTVRYVCRLHIKTIGSLEWYHIERLEHNTTIRRNTLFKWKEIQKEEREKKIKKWNKKRKSGGKKQPETHYNAHYPIINGNYQDRVPYPSNNSNGDE